MKFKFALTIFIVGIFIGWQFSPFLPAKPKGYLQVPTVLPIEAWQESKSPKTINKSTSDRWQKKNIVMNEIIQRQDRELIFFNDKTETQKKSGQVLGESSQIIKNNFAGEVTISIFGDSMVDTMGTNMPYLKKALQAYYPLAKFRLLNYGIGAQSVSSGLARFGQAYSYKDRNYPAIGQSGAKIIIIESFAYNPVGEAGLDRQWQDLSQMVQQAQASGAKVLLLATIAPHRGEFGKGPGGVNWPADQSWQQAMVIGKYLENTIRLANSLKIPVVDAYHPSLDKNGEGNLALISNHDHIHPSIAGHQFIANLIARKIYKLNLVN